MSIYVDNKRGTGRKKMRESLPAALPGQARRATTALARSGLGMRKTRCSEKANLLKHRTNIVRTTGPA